MDIISLVVGLVIGGVLTYIALEFRDRSNGVLDDEEFITNADAIRHIGNNESVRGGNPRSGHIRLDKLMIYIGLMKRAATNTTEDIAGLEIYMARYDETDMDDPNGLNYVIYPTYLGKDDEGNDTYIPFDPVSSTNIKVVKVMDLVSGDFPNNRSALNKSNMSPPKRLTWTN